MGNAKDNTGDDNTGTCNTGDDNTGHRNTGDFNTGKFNTGDFNTGKFNTGDFNTGKFNTGKFNTGDGNTGDFNTGKFNTGTCNTGHRNTGHFCTEDGPLRFFDKAWDGTWAEAAELIPAVELHVGAIWTPTEDMTAEEKAENPNHAVVGGYLRASALRIQDAFPVFWAKAGEATRQRFLDLPNFDAEKFLACTGVDVRRPAPGDTTTVDGVLYRRVKPQ